MLFLFQTTESQKVRINIIVKKKKKYTLKELEKKLWESADKMRGAVPVSSYKFIIIIFVYFFNYFSIFIIFIIYFIQNKIFFIF